MLESADLPERALARLGDSRTLTMIASLGLASKLRGGLARMGVGVANAMAAAARSKHSGWAVGGRFIGFSLEFSGIKTLLFGRVRGGGERRQNHEKGS
jgi:hypothetical protein